MRFYGAKLVLHYGLQLPGGRWETVPLGVYTVAEAERRALYVSIKAYDNILALAAKNTMVRRCRARPMRCWGRSPRPVG